jgi:cytochrome c553
MMTQLRTSTVMSLALALSFLLTGCEGASPDKAGLKYSEDLYDGCVQCHGENGEGNQQLGSPAIAGLERWYIKAQLRKFKKSQRGWHIDDMAGKRMQPMAMAMNTDEPRAYPRRGQPRNRQDLLRYLCPVPRGRCTGEHR